MSVKKDIEVGVGPAKAQRKAGKYVVETPKGRLEFDNQEEIMHLRLALDALVQQEWQEIQEERKAKGQKTYVEYRGGEVVKAE
jgi:hypothetical protein